MLREGSMLMEILREGSILVEILREGSILVEIFREVAFGHLGSSSPGIGM